MQYSPPLLSEACVGTPCYVTLRMQYHCRTVRGVENFVGDVLWGLSEFLRDNTTHAENCRVEDQWSALSLHATITVPSDK